MLPGVARAATPDALVISELQTSGMNAGTANGRLEFVELYNPTATPLDTHGWQLNYFGGTGDITGTPTRMLAILQGTVAAGGFVLIASPDFTAANPSIQTDISFDAVSTTTSTSGWLAQGGGAVQLADSGGITRDAVSWGTAKQNGTWWKSSEIAAGSSIKRILPGDPAFTVDGVFSGPGIPTPQGGGLQASPPAQPQSSCTGLTLSEVLPNAAGVDTGHEFVELYNPTSAPVSMVGCSLRLGDAGAPFALPDESVQPGAYRTFADTESHITLPNATGDTIWLLSANDEQGVRYPDSMADDTAWALIDDVWQTTFAPTPGAANIMLAKDAGGQGAGSDAETLAPCAAGKERNPDTNRCRDAVTTANALQPCQAGQTRNAETNRCRAVLAASTSTLTPCKPGQERNPDTNRCRSIATASASSLTPCAPGQERNPATNRCRKAASSASFAKTQDDSATASTASKVGWWLAGIAVLGAAGYGVYEWRTDIRRATRSLRMRFIRTAK
jgi:hypothetical protein